MLRYVPLLLLLFPGVLCAQSSVDELKRSSDAGQRVFDQRVAGERPDTTVVDLSQVDKQPEFPGGAQAMYKYIGSHTRYPSDALKAGLEGKVFTEFVIGADGKVGHVTVKRGVHASLDKEAVRVVSSMPDWTLGEKDGKKVAVRYVLPMSFQLPQ